MAITFSVQPGYQFTDSERVTYSKLNLLGNPGIVLAGTVDSSEIQDGAVTTQKLVDSIDINSKVDDHNLALTKLAAGTHGQLLYYNASGDLVTLPPGTDGYFLKTKGTGNDPEWASQEGIGTIPYTSITTDGNDKYLTTSSSGALEWINKPTSVSLDTHTTGDVESIRTAGNELHTIGYLPEHIRVTLFCAVDDTANTGYDVGDEIEIGHNFWSQTNENRNAVNVIYHAASQSVRIQFESGYSSPDNFRIQHKTGGNSVECTTPILQHFKFRIRTWQSGFASSGTDAGPLTSEPGYYFSGTTSSSASDYIFGTTPETRTATFSHGLGSVPKLVRAVFVATEGISELDLAVQDEVDINNMFISFGKGHDWNPFQVKSGPSQLQLSLSTGITGGLPVASWLSHSGNNRIIQMTDAIASKLKLKIYAWK